MKRFLSSYLAFVLFAGMILWIASLFGCASHVEQEVKADAKVERQAEGETKSETRSVTTAPIRIETHELFRRMREDAPDAGPAPYAAAGIDPYLQERVTIVTLAPVATADSSTFTNLKSMERADFDLDGQTEKNSKPSLGFLVGLWPFIAIGGLVLFLVLTGTNPIALVMKAVGWFRKRASAG